MMLSIYRRNHKGLHSIMLIKMIANLPEHGRKSFDHAPFLMPTMIMFGENIEWKCI